MPHDPHAQFDQAVLDIIEHSPVGAVPHTPAYQDALLRLYAAHQVYAAADFKDGHVTVRSLAKHPVFHANNLDELIAGEISVEVLEPNAAIYDRYVQSLPADRRIKAENFRAIVAGRPTHHRKHAGAAAHDPVHTLFLVPGAGPHHGLPGNYLYGYILEVSPDAWALHLHDSDDGAVLIRVGSMKEALDELQEVLSSAPFHMSELEALGFKQN